jgi:hypothetical protein
VLFQGWGLGCPRYAAEGRCSAEILRGESLALPRTPLSQDDGGGGGFVVTVGRILVGIPFGVIWFASAWGSFDCVASSLREEATALKMTVCWWSGSLWLPRLEKRETWGTLCLIVCGKFGTHRSDVLAPCGAQSGEARGGGFRTGAWASAGEPP